MYQRLETDEDKGVSISTMVLCLLFGSTDARDGQDHCNTQQPEPHSDTKVCTQFCLAKCSISTTANTVSWIVYENRIVVAPGLSFVKSMTISFFNCGFNPVKFESPHWSGVWGNDNINTVKKEVNYLWILAKSNIKRLHAQSSTCAQRSQKAYLEDF